MRDFFEFKWKYYLQKLIAPSRKREITNKVLFISQTGTEDWILGAKARRLSRFYDGDSEVMFSNKFKNIPIAPAYFFLHQKYYSKALRYNPHLKKANCVVMFTHPEWNKFYSKSHAEYTLKHASKVVCLNKNMANELVSIGINPGNIEVYHMASNPDVFTPKKKRLGRTIGFCCAYYERKNPQLVLNLIKRIDDLNIILVGRGWDQCKNFNDLLSKENFTYYADMDYKLYPDLYKKMDVFVSPSFLEGGPVPLLEAMMSNVVPVASDTGFCPDLIKHGTNGFLFNPETDSVEQIEKLIRQALKIEGNISKEVEGHSWKNYGSKIYQLHSSFHK